MTDEIKAILELVTGSPYPDDHEEIANSIKLFLTYFTSDTTVEEILSGLEL